MYAIGIIGSGEKKASWRVEPSGHVLYQAKPLRPPFFLAGYVVRKSGWKS